MLSFTSVARHLGVAWLLAMALSSIAMASPVAKRAATDRLVFCHFMIGICGDRSSADDYDNDMTRAKAYGIDAFALNIGVDPYTDAQLGYAYASAARNGMKVFISFDFNWWSPGDASGVGAKIAQYAGQAAQLTVDGRVFASSFAGDGLDVATMKSAAGSNVYFVPNFHPGQSSSADIDGALNWLGWPNNGNNKAPDASGNVTVADGDASYMSWLDGKPYLAPVSAWFSTHYGPEVSYSKNWVFPSDTLIYDRWNQVLQEGFPMVELITWNDYGESHYIGPLESKHYDDGNSKWTNDMPHDAWLDLAEPYIAAYHDGATSVDSYITSDKIIYWYRRTPRGLDCDATDTTYNQPANNASGNYFEGRPDGWQSMQDEVFVVTLLTAAGSLTVNSGGNVQTQAVPAGANLVSVPMGVGAQSFSLSRGGATVLSGTSLMEIEDVCPCGIYNFNAYVGSLPASFSDPLQADGLVSLTIGLHVTTCAATPSLGTAPPPPASTTSIGTTPPSTTATSPPKTTTTTKTTTSPPKTTTTTSNKPPSSTSTKTTSTSPPTQTGTCIAGTVAQGETGNYLGLCNFCCNYGYCPPGPCVCTSQGSPVSPPPETGTPGCPIAGEGAGYDGLCSFACGHGYCPPTACTTSC